MDLKVIKERLVIRDKLDKVVIRYMDFFKFYIKRFACTLFKLFLGKQASDLSLKYKLELKASVCISDQDIGCEYFILFAKKIHINIYF